MEADAHTISEQFLDVGDGHKLYVQEWGNKDSAQPPIISLHGGPGSATKDKHKAPFNPEKQRVIFFHQRGAGKSTPTGSLQNNTTTDLIEDINKIADHFKLPPFVLIGGSWGSCLAFAYAIEYPKRVAKMILYGIYTGTEAETDHLDKGQFRNIFPDVWDAYLARTPKEFHDDPSEYHYKNIFGTDPVKAKESAYAYSELEGSIIQLDDRHTPDDFEDFDPSSMSIEMYYLYNKCFLPDEHILKNAHKLTMPIFLVQGRYDLVCPPVTAYNLDKKLPNSTLIFTIAGHRTHDKGNSDVIGALLANE